MNFADIKGGTWYPQGGMYSVVKAMKQLAEELGVQFKFDEEVSEIIIDKSSAKKLITSKNEYVADVVISGADYHFTEKHLLPEIYRSYSEKYWDQKILAPSCLLYYVGVNKKLKNVLHHSLFFDVSFDQHAGEIYSKPQWPSHPLFYVSASSITDTEVAPAGFENLVFLIPVAAGLKDDSEELRTKYFDAIITRFEKHTGQQIKDAIIYKKTFSVSDFARDYNSYKGNAYGLANELYQIAIFRPYSKS